MSTRSEFPEHADDNRRIWDANAPPSPRDLVARHVASTLVLVLSWWVDTDATLTPADVHARFRALVSCVPVRWRRKLNFHQSVPLGTPGILAGQMRVRLLAAVIMATLIIAQTDFACVLFCRSTVNGDTQGTGHAHHHATSTASDVSWQAALHACSHDAGLQVVVGATARPSGSATPAPTPAPIALRGSLFAPTVVSLHGTPPGRAAPPGGRTPLPPLRI